MKKLVAVVTCLLLLCASTVTGDWLIVEEDESILARKLSLAAAAVDELLLETGDKLLLETGDKLLLE